MVLFRCRYLLVCATHLCSTVAQAALKVTGRQQEEDKRQRLQFSTGFPFLISIIIIARA